MDKSAFKGCLESWDSPPILCDSYHPYFTVSTTQPVMARFRTAQSSPKARARGRITLYDAALQRQMGVMIDAITPQTTGSVARYQAWSG